MKKHFVLCCLIGLAGSAFAQAPVVPKYQYMQLTTIESLIPGGSGRSRMLVTNADGNAQELPLENVFSLGGINFGNIKGNDKAIVIKVNQLTQEGWELSETIAAANDGLFITRYLLRRPR
ncbi:MAG: hypothetical protein H7Z75_02300 [Ferruginibacter sp.]|nr:hypothetical protein [Cytophagales bacterium]